MKYIAYRSGHAMALDRVRVTPSAIDLVLAVLALPWIQPQQHHQAVHNSVAPDAPEFTMSAIGAGPHQHLDALMIAPLSSCCDKSRQLCPDHRHPALLATLGYVDCSIPNLFPRTRLPPRVAGVPGPSFHRRSPEVAAALHLPSHRRCRRRSRLAPHLSSSSHRPPQPLARVS